MDPSSKGKPKTSTGNANANLDILFRPYDAYGRTMDGFQGSMEEIQKKYEEADKLVNFGIGYVEDKKMTQGVSQGATITGVYSVKDIVFNENLQEYLAVTKYGELYRYDWAGTKLQAPRPPTKSFTRFIYCKPTGHYICWTPKKSSFFLAKDDFTVVIDTVAIAPIGNIIFGGRKTEESFDFFIICDATLNRYSYSPSGNVIRLQDCMKLSDVEADNGVIENTCFDDPQDDRKQWIYCTYNSNCAIVDVTGRVLGARKGLHEYKITAIVATGGSEFVVTGDEKGILKLWGQRWAYIAEIQAHKDRVSHLMEHPHGRAALSFSRDQSVCTWNFDTKKKHEQLVSPEVVERLTINKQGKSFMTQGARKLVIWRMDVVYEFRTKLSAPTLMIKSTWHPDTPSRIVAFTSDNSFRIINPNTGVILSSVILPFNAPPATYFEYHRTPTVNNIYLIWNGENTGLDIHCYDCNSNPAKLKSTWQEQNYDSTITSFAVYNRTPKMELFEKQLLVFMNRKNKDQNNVGDIFLIVGRNDGNVALIEIETGTMMYEQKCHAASVRDIVIDHEVNQFISLGIDPSARLWKICVSLDEVFVPLMDIIWKYPIRFISMVRDIIAFVLTHPDIKQHKVCMYSTSRSERMDHRAHYSHMKEIISFSSHRELELFCSASTDETVRIWNAKNEMIRCVFLNWIPTIAAFGTKQGDIFVGIDNTMHVITANKYLTIIYRNRVLQYGYNAGENESALPFVVAKVGRDQRLILIADEPIEQPPLPIVEYFNEPRESQRAKDLELLRIREEDIKAIIAGNHPIENNVPDPRNMSKKEWDDFGKTVFDDDDEERKFFVSESRLACMLKMKGERKGFETYDNIF